jgi:hypothetical protein
VVAISSEAAMLAKTFDVKFDSVSMALEIRIRARWSSSPRTKSKASMFGLACRESLD